MFYITQQFIGARLASSSSAWSFFHGGPFNVAIVFVVASFIIDLVLGCHAVTEAQS